MGVALWPEQQSEALVPDEIFAHQSIRPHVEYRTDPIGWAVDKLGIPENTIRWGLNKAFGKHQWDGDVDPIALMFEALRDWKDVGVESGTGTGKSFAVAVLILWFLACWEGARVFTFAPKEDQLRLYIWTEIGKLWFKFKAHFPTALLTDLCIRVRGGTDDSWGARGYAVGVRVDEEVATKAAGMHAEHMLLVYEEMPGIPKSVVAAGENTSTAPHNLRIAIGNPNSQLDTLHQYCMTPGVVHVRMSALDHPNVVMRDPNFIPGAVSQTSIDRRLAKYGADSPVYQSRVRGMSPEQASDALIRLEWLKAAAQRFAARKAAGTLPTRLTGKGVDVANSEHGDAGAIVNFYENVATKPHTFACPDSNALGRRVSLEIVAAGMDPRRVSVDGIGVGAGTVNELRRLGKIVTAFIASERPQIMAEKRPDGSMKEWSPDVNLFKNLRSQAYWQTREDLRLGVLDVEEDQELWEELTAFTFVDDPKTVVEDKDEVKARLGRSPNSADAFVMGNWSRERALSVPEEIETPPRARRYDYAKKQIEEREDGEGFMEKILTRAQPRPLAGRYGRR